MKSGGIIACLFLLVVACRQKDEIPSNILPQAKMKALMWDLMRADQFLGNYLLKDSSHDRTGESLKYYQRIFSIHKVTREQFNESFAYYRARPALFKSVLDSISTPEEVKIQIAEPAPALFMPDTATNKPVEPKYDTTGFRKKNPAVPD